MTLQVPQDLSMESSCNMPQCTGLWGMLQALCLTGLS